MRDFVVNIIVTKALPIFAAALSTFVMSAAKRLWSWIDEQGPLTQRAIVVALSVAIPFVLTAAGQQLPVECSVISDGVTKECWDAITASRKVVSGVIGSLLAFAWHASRNR